MKVKVSMELRNDYPNKSYTEIEKLSDELFGSIDQAVKETGSFELANKELNRRWDLDKGRLSYKFIRKGKELATLMIKFSTEYPSLKHDYRNGYVKADIYLESIQEYLDKTILDELKAKFDSLKEKTVKNYKPIGLKKKKAKLKREFRRDFHGTHRQELKSIGQGVFKGLENFVKGHKDFILLKSRYDRRCMFGDWNVVKGKLVSKVLQEGEVRSDLQVKFLAAYPFMCHTFEEGYIQMEVKVATERGYIDERIFDDLEKIFNTIKKEDKKQG